MTIKFDRPTGAPADVAELEYLIALQQTDNKTIAPTVSASDIRRYLTSRHGLRIPLTQLNTEIFQQLAGSCWPLDKEEVEAEEESVHSFTDMEIELDSGDDQKQQAVLSMDLVQQVALLLIPELLKMADSNSEDATAVVDVVLLSILKEANLTYGDELSTETLQRILEAYGEEDECPHETRQQMIEMCKTEHEMPILDTQTFLRGLTVDVKDKYPLDRESAATTHYQDALSKDGRELERIYTAPSIDGTADTHRSFWWTVLSWATLIVVFFAYFIEGWTNIRRGLPAVDCDNTTLSRFGCLTVNGIIIWLEIFLELSVLGTLFIFLSTLGNSVYDLNMSKWKAILMNCLGIVVVVFCTILAFNYEVETPLFITKKENDSGAKYYAALVLGCMLIVVQLGQLIRLVVPVTPTMRPYFASGALKMERWTKQAASYKMERMIDNAFACRVEPLLGNDDGVTEDPSLSQIMGQLVSSLHNKVTSSRAESMDGVDTEMTETPDSLMYSKASSILSAPTEQEAQLADTLLRFHLYSDFTTLTGGVLWTWRRILWDRTLFSREGIWLFPRLVASNLGQWFVCCLIPVLWVLVARYARNNFDELDGFVTVREIEVGIAIGALAAIFAAVSVSIIYIPSAVSTILQYRSGVIGSLKDGRFDVYRHAQDTTTMLFGSAFWGILFTAIVTWFVIGAIALLLVWKEIREVILGIFAVIIGILVTIALKMIILLLLRANWFAAFYRRKPACANILTVVLECWNLGLSTGYIVARISKILLVSMLYIGRIDTPFLAPGVGCIFGVPLDSYSTAFRKDLLAHEAHRHPYLERLGLMYMLKLRHGPDFGCSGGTGWRMLFVLALMPWLRKYRNVGNNNIQRQQDKDSAKPMSLSSLYAEKQALQLENEALRRRNEELERLARNEPRRRKTWFVSQSVATGDV